MQIEKRKEKLNLYIDLNLIIEKISQILTEKKGCSNIVETESVIPTPATASSTEPLPQHLSHTPQPQTHNPIISNEQINATAEEFQNQHNNENGNESTVNVTRANDSILSVSSSEDSFSSSLGSLSDETLTRIDRISTHANNANE